MTVLTSLGWGTPTDSYALVSDIIMIPYTSYSCLYKLMFSITKKKEKQMKNQNIGSFYLQSHGLNMKCFFLYA